jgi:hypothetical protein
MRTMVRIPPIPDVAYIGFPAPGEVARVAQHARFISATCRPTSTLKISDLP